MNDIQVVKQKSVKLYDDDLLAVQAEDGQVYVAINQMCRALDIDAQGQRRRMERHAILAKGLKGVDKLSTPGGVQSGYVLRVDLVPLWLSGIRISAVKEEVRPKLEHFQAEAAAVLWEAFQEGRLTAVDTELNDLLNSDSDAAQAYRMLQAMVKLARNQLIMEAQLNQQTQRLDTHDLQLTDYGQRLEEIETTLGAPDHQVTPDQAMQISQAVKAIALALSKQTKRNEFGAVYGELYRKFGITSYKLLPAKRFTEAMDFLTNWHQEIVGDAPF